MLRRRSSFTRKGPSAISDPRDETERRKAAAERLKYREAVIRLAAAIIAAVTAILGFFSVIQPRLKLVSLACLALATTFFLILGWRRESSALALPSGQPGRRWVRDSLTPIGRLGFTFSAITLLIALFWTPAGRMLRHGKLVVAVADFVGPENSARVTDVILDQLREVERDLPEVRIEALGDSITEAMGSRVAQAKGRQRGAGIVIWGWYALTKTTLRATFHFELLEPRDVGILRANAGTKHNLMRQASQFANFEVPLELASQARQLVLVTAGMSRYIIEDYEGALARFNMALAGLQAERVIVPGLYYYRSSAHEHLRQLDRALEDLDTLIALRPTLADAYNARGNVHVFRDELDPAIADYRTAIALRPHFAEAFNNLGNVYRMQGMLASAIASYDSALAYSPGDATAYLNRATVFGDSGLHIRAFADVDTAIRLGRQTTAAPYMIRGDVYRRLDLADSAIAEYGRAIQLAPDYADGYLSRGNTYELIGLADLAQADYNTAMKLTPQDPSIYANRGVLYTRERKLDSALADFNTAIALNPRFAEAYYNRAEVYSQKGLRDNAISDYDSAIRLKARFPEAYFNRGVLHIEKEMLAEAMGDYDTAIALGPATAELYTIRGVLYGRLALRTHRKDLMRLGIADLDSAIARNPDSAEIYMRRGVAYKFLEQREKAIADFRRVVQLARDTPTHNVAQAELRELGAR